MWIAPFTVSSPVRSGQLLASFELPAPAAAAGHVELVFNGVRKTASSLVLRLSVSAATTTRIVAGYLYTYGEGPPVPNDTSGRFFPMVLSLDITDAIRELNNPRHLDVHVDIQDAHGRNLTDEALELESVELRMDPSL